MLGSFLTLKHPDDIQVSYIFVENSDTLNIRDIVQESGLPRVWMDNEPRLGIPFVRNRILDIALAHGQDYLVFCDDDQTVDESYLVEHLEAARSRGLDMAGGAAKMEPLADLSGLTLFQRRAYQYMRATSDETIRRHASKQGNQPIGCNSMLCRLDFVRQHGIRFNEALEFSHGEDLDFYYQAKVAGARTGHTDRAVVYECVIESRLSLAGFFKRYKSLGLSYYNLQYAWGKKKRSISRSVCTALWGSLAGVLLICAAPLNRGRSLVSGVRKISRAVARLQSLQGLRGRYYMRTEGN